MDRIKRLKKYFFTNKDPPSGKNGEIKNSRIINGIANSKIKGGRKRKRGNKF